MVKRHKTAQYLSGFIYTDNNQSYPLPNGGRVTGRCEYEAVCKNTTQYQVNNGGGVEVVVSGQNMYKDEDGCTGQCIGQSYLPLAHDNQPDCNTGGGTWKTWNWHPATMISGVEDEFECMNVPPLRGAKPVWISYVGSKYIESDFLPAEEWRKQIGFRWGKMSAMTADGAFIPFSTQFRDTGGSLCIKNACYDTVTGLEDPALSVKTACVGMPNREWRVTKLVGVCKDSATPPVVDPALTTKLTCETAGKTWFDATDPTNCKDQGGVALSDPGDKFDTEIPKGFLPSFYSPTVNNFIGSGVTTSVTLNPFASGHNISVVGRNAELDNSLGDAQIRKADYGEKIGTLSRKPEPDDSQSGHRPMALRGPLVVAGWGYDTADLPVPNEFLDADEYTVDALGKTIPVYPGHCAGDPGTDNREDCESSANGSCSLQGYCEDSNGDLIAGKNSSAQCTAANGIFTAYANEADCANGVAVGNGTSAAGIWTTKSWVGPPQHANPDLHFYFNHLKRPDKWKVGPVDLKWDRDRKVWVGGGNGGGGGAGISLCKATRCILPQAGSDGKNSFNFGILDNINSPGRLYRNPCSRADCGFGTYFPKSPMYPDIDIYDPEDYEWCGSCKVKKDSAGNYYVACDDFHSTCVPFYDAIVIRDMKDYIWGNNRNITADPSHHHSLRGGDTNCGDKFSKTHRGDPYARRMGDPCHEFGNSIIGEQIPLSANSIYPKASKSVLYKRVLIENPLGQGLMVGDSFLSADTGKRITVEYVRKKPGTGSSNCTGANASPETVKEVLPVHIILQGEFYGQEILTAMGCEQGEASACSKKIMVQGLTTMEDCGPNDDYPQSATTY